MTPTLTEKIAEMREKFKALKLEQLHARVGPSLNDELLMDALECGYDKGAEALLTLLKEQGAGDVNEKALMELVKLDDKLACGSGKELNKMFLLIARWQHSQDAAVIGALRAALERGES